MKWTTYLLAGLSPLTFLELSLLGQQRITVSAPNPAIAGPQWFLDLDPGTPAVERCLRVNTNVTAIVCGTTEAHFAVDVYLYNVAQPVKQAQCVLQYDTNYITAVCVDSPTDFDFVGGFAGCPGPGQVFLDAPNPITQNCLVGTLRVGRVYFQAQGASGLEGQSGIEVVPGAAPILGNCFSGVNVTMTCPGGASSADMSEGQALVVVDSLNRLSCLNVNSVGDQDARNASRMKPVTTDAPAGIGKVTLRSAISVANTNLGTNLITFRIPDSGGAPPWTIMPLTLLPTLKDLTGGTKIDGTNRPGVVITPGAGAATDGLSITSASNQVVGLSINSFAGSGVKITGTAARKNSVIGNTIGLNGIGVLISGANSNTVGGLTPAARNLISGNLTDGLQINGGGRSNVVQGNYIGLAADGLACQANNREGVSIINSPSNDIGGTNAAARNIISCNGANGVSITLAGSTSNLVRGNFIGTDKTGLVGRGNAANGVLISAAGGNAVGGLTSSAGTPPGNVISGNAGDGVKLMAGAANNVVQGNYIGVNSSGLGILGNNGSGVEINTASGNEIGGSTVTARNIISANGRQGVDVESATVNLVRGNYIGTDKNGMGVAFGNLQNGVLIFGGNLNTVGGTTLSPGLPRGNVICDNGLDGVQLASGTFNNSIQGNYIGLDSTGVACLQNRGNGVRIDSSPNNEVGGGDNMLVNIIACNLGSGVLISHAPAMQNRVRNNRIGTDASGMQAKGNVHGGVVIEQGATQNDIGGSNAGDGNLISGNPLDAVLIDGPGSDANLVANNLIGPDVGRSVSVAPAGGLAGVHIRNANQTMVSNNVAEGNRTRGLFLEGASQSILIKNFIGSSSIPNRVHGIHLQTITLVPGVPGGVSSLDNQVTLNLIGNNIGDGLRLEGTTPDVVRGNVVLANNIIGHVPNPAADSDGSGLSLIGNAQSNTIGGLVFGTGNILGGNAGNGVSLRPGALAALPRGNTLSQNYIGLNSTGNAASPNLQSGVFVAGTANTIGPSNVISANTLHGVLVAGPQASGNSVQGNLIGPGASGFFALGNGQSGVMISNAPGTLVGGQSPDLRNVISGNLSSGVSILGPAASANVVQGNFIGLVADGSAALANQLDGVNIRDAVNNTLGGAVAAAHNTISGNRSNGVSILGDLANNNFVQGNLVGTDSGGFSSIANLGAGIWIRAPNNFVGGLAVVNGTAPGNRVRGNHGAGVVLANAPGGLSGAATVQGNSIEFNLGAGLVIDSSDNAIGGVLLGAPNNIQFNGADGVQINGSRNLLVGNAVRTNTGAGLLVLGSANAAEGNGIIANGSAGVLVSGTNSGGNRFTGDIIFDNGGLGIDLSNAGPPDGVTPNDADDADTGANGLQNFPVIVSATTNSGGSVTLVGTLNGQANSAFQLEFFANQACDPSGHGEGQTYLGTAAVTTAGNGIAAFRVTLPMPAPGNDFVTATATDANGSTSEFSQCVQATGSGGVTLSIARSSDGGTISWPSSATGYLLEGTDDLTPPIVWQIITNGISDDGTIKSYSITNYPAAGQGFFRLISP